MSCTCESYYSYVCPACRPRPKADLAAMCERLRMQLSAALEVVAAADAMRVAGIASSWQGGKFLPSPEAQAYDGAREKLRRLQDG